MWLGASPPSGCEGIYRRLCGEEDGMDKGVRGRMRKEKAIQGSFEDGMGLGRAGPEIRVRGA